MNSNVVNRVIVLTESLRRSACYALLFVALASPSSAAQSLPQVPLETAGPNQTDAQRAAQPSRDQRDEIRVFGQNLFTGAFVQDRFAGFNPDYRISTGDMIQLQLWGAVDFQGLLSVDAQGNIFVPQVGPVSVRGVANNRLLDTVEAAVKSVYRENVRVYANLDESQPVNLFVTGYVRSPGLYSGRSSDSLLTYLDRAGGVDPQRGSYLDIRLMRRGETLDEINLYDFLLRGVMPYRQLQEGDTLVVGPRQFVVQFAGLAENAAAIEFDTREIALPQGLQIAGVLPNATHVRIERNSGVSRSAEYFPLAEAHRVRVRAGDRVELVEDKAQSTITVRIEGEHRGLNQIVLPYGATLGQLLDRIEPGPQSDLSSVQLFRRSVAQRQKQMLQVSLENLQMSVLTAPSATAAEANLRTQEAELVLKFIDRASQIEPQGQVVLANAPNLRDVVLEDEDRVRIPAFSRLITVYGEVMLPTALLHSPGARMQDYLNQAGGLSRKADRSRIVVRAPDGSIQLARLPRLFRAGIEVDIEPGYEIMVLPEIDFKTLQFTKDIVQIVYQTAIAAGVVLAL
ncbi:MAG: polysaccharide biosynthesis/export family protein [Saccharospirillum sp.]|nr:polysaccharide biosynthesis/export family protein [Saccharospirillum sp.]